MEYWNRAKQETKWLATAQSDLVQSSCKNKLRETVDKMATLSDLLKRVKSELLPYKR